VVRRNGTNLARLIDDLLDLSRAEAGRLEIRRAPCRPRDVVAEVLDLLRTAADLKGLTLGAEAAPDVAEEIFTDGLRLQQILWNLTGNAIKYTERGSVTVWVRNTGPGSVRPMLRFDVVDTGVGVAPEALDGLFQPFQRGDARSYGAGLGLAISRRMAELLGGSLEVQSVPGRGSTFSLLIGVSGPDDPAPQPTSQGQSATAVSPPPRAPSVLNSRCRILVAEDHGDNRRALSRRLGLAGAEVTAVADGLQAATVALAAAAADRPFAVILMDMHMPVMDGFEATGQLRAAGYRGAIVALTADARAEDRTECLRLGCDEHLAKPVDWNQLISLIERFTPADSPDTDTTPAQ
jgi:two-component system CheB/CheR fusion protein